MSRSKLIAKKSKPSPKNAAESAQQASLQELFDWLAAADAIPAVCGLREFVATLPELPNRIPDRRRHPRHSILMDVKVAPINAAFNPIDDPFIGCCRNISTSGICFFHARRLQCELLVIELKVPGLPPMEAVAKILRQRIVGPFVEIAGQFLDEATGKMR